MDKYLQKMKMAKGEKEWDKVRRRMQKHKQNRTHTQAGRIGCPIEWHYS